jgi:copper chaperone
MRIEEIKVEGMTCSHCVDAIENALMAAGHKGKVDLKRGIVVVEYDDSGHDLNDINECMVGMGYSVQIKSRYK